MKKSANKSTKKNIYNGRNIYGQRCIAKFVKLEKENALDQYLAIMADIENTHGEAIDYTIDSSCFTREEAIQFSNKITRIMELRARVKGLGFVTGDFTLPQIPA